MYTQLADVRVGRSRALAWMVFGTLLGGVTGCGGGGSSDGGGVAVGIEPVATLLQPYAQPGSGEVFGESEARHLLRRIAFSAPQAEVDRCVRDGLPKTLDRLLTQGRDAAAEADAQKLLEDPMRPGLWELQRSWLSLMVRTKSPVREKMGLFWHQRLAASGRMLGDSAMRWTQEYRDLLRTEGLGNYRTLLKALTRNGTMLVWLSGLPSDKAHPNENYAREFWELFTLGTDVRYTQADIQESARALTGWDSTYDETTKLESLVFNVDAHDDGSKTILGQTGNWREDDVVDITLATPEAGTFLARRLLEGFCYRNPPQELVDEIAAAARSHDWEIRPLVRTILESKAFFSAPSRKTQVADPVVQMIGMARATQIPLEWWELLESADAMGQVPLDPPSVKGFPQGLGWSGEQALLDRARMVDTLAGKTDVTRPGAPDQKDHVFVHHLLPAGDANGKITGAATVDFLAHLLDVTLTASERQVLVDYMDTVPDDTGTLVPSPFDGNVEDQVEVKVRGLLSILGQHPDAMKN